MGKMNGMLLYPKKRGYTPSFGTQKEDRRKLLRKQRGKENYDLHLKGNLWVNCLLCRNWPTLGGAVPPRSGGMPKHLNSESIRYG